MGNEHQAEVHLFEVRHDETLPAELATIEWLAMNRSEYSVFLPFYSALLDETDAVYRCDWTNNDGENWAYYNPAEDMELFGDVVDSPADLPENSMFWVFAALNDMCDNDREHYGVNVRAFWEAYQTALIEKQAAVDKAMLNLWKADPALAQKSATALGKAIARETYSCAKQIMDELWDFSRDYEAGKLDKDAVFEPSILGWTTPERTGSPRPWSGRRRRATPRVWSCPTAPSPGRSWRSCCGGSQGPRRWSRISAALPTRIRSPGRPWRP